MYKEVDINSWNRKEHFEFFSKFDEPFFGVVTEIDCTKAYKTVKEKKLSFFAFYLHNSLNAINQIDEFKTRIKDGSVVLYDKHTPRSGRIIASRDQTPYPWAPFFQQDDAVR